MTRSLLAALIVLTALLATLAGTAAQDSSPVAELSIDDPCDVIPRSEDDLATLNAAADRGAATPAPVVPIEMPSGEPVDAATLNALDETLLQVDSCAESGVLEGLLALYSDAYVTSIALAPELVPIIPGQPRDHPGGPVGTPSPESGVVPQVESAVLLADGRIAAAVSAEGLSGTADVVIFVQERERWVIDEVHEALPQGALGGELPFPVQAAVAAAAAEFDGSIEEVTVGSWEAIEWGDTSLGCPKDGEFYAQVITPGYRATLDVKGEAHEYHTDEIDRAIRCDPA